ncbi:MAG: hypothetical protein KTR31_38985 [Myxococcales bacterium]|nr:hypothetical protein [Myxococcales bacterium]
MNFISWLLRSGLALVVLAVPVLGVWTASSLAAYLNGPVWLVCLAGLLLFPIGPVAWGLWATRRRRRRSEQPESFLGELARRQQETPVSLTSGDRLMLRTVALNGAFLAVLLWGWPDAVHTALAGRGDWMLDGRHDRTSETVRSLLHVTADAFDWLFVDDESYDGLAEQPTPPPPPTPDPPSAPDPAPAADPLAWPIEESLHPAIAEVPSEAESSIASLGEWLKVEFPDARERVRVMHDWVAEHVVYDFEGLADGSYTTRQSSAEVFASRRAVCAGYSNLMVALGQVTGDEIVFISGFSRDDDGGIKGTGHAWNAVNLDDTWHLIDVTWDAGSRGEDGTFRKAYGTSYLFTPPEVFVTTHLPDDARWQLIDPPISRGAFTRMPMMTADFYAQGLSFHSDVRSQITVDGTLELSLDNPQDRSILATAEPHGGGSGERCQVAGADRVTVTCRFTEPGRYELVLYTNDHRSGQHWSVGRIQVNAARGGA